MAAPALTQYVQGLGQVSGDGLNTFEQTCDTFAQLRGLTGLPGMQVFARGGISIADGLQGIFYWSASNPGPDNGSTVIVPNGALIGAWVKLALAANSNLALGQCRLLYTSTTLLTLTPYNGNSIQIAGGVYAIPAAGITAANTGVYINGAPGGNLVASTLYYVYLFSLAGTPTIDFSTTGYAQDTTIGNIGVYIKNSTPSRSLVGMVYVDASSHFNDVVGLRNVASWFNRQLKQIQGSGTAGATTTSVTLVELTTSARVEATVWADDAIMISIIGPSSQSGAAGNVTSVNVGMDGAANNFPQSAIFENAAANYRQSAGLSGYYAPSEGHHFWTPVASVNANTGTFNLSILGGVRS